MLIVAMDANFCLKSRLRGSLNREPTLGLGWAYFVNNGPYLDFIKEYVDQDEVHLLPKGRNSWLTAIVDSNMCWVSSVAQHAHKKVKRSPCNGHGRSQLCPPSVILAVGYGQLAEGRVVCYLVVFLEYFLIGLQAV